MDLQTVREQFVIDTYRRLQPDCDAHIEARGVEPLICLVITQAGAGRYSVAAICDRYALNAQDKADETTTQELAADGVWVDGGTIPVRSFKSDSEPRSRERR